MDSRLFTSLFDDKPPHPITAYGLPGSGDVQNLAAATANGFKIPAAAGVDGNSAFDVAQQLLRRGEHIATGIDLLDMMTDDQLIQQGMEPRSQDNGANYQDFAVPPFVTLDVAKAVAQLRRLARFNEALGKGKMVFKLGILSATASPVGQGDTYWAQTLSTEPDLATPPGLKILTVWLYRRCSISAAGDAVEHWQALQVSPNPQMAIPGPDTVMPDLFAEHPADDFQFDFTNFDWDQPMPGATDGVQMPDWQIEQTMQELFPDDPSFDLNAGSQTLPGAVSDAEMAAAGELGPLLLNNRGQLPYGIPLTGQVTNNQFALQATATFPPNSQWTPAPAGVYDPAASQLPVAAAPSTSRKRPRTADSQDQSAAPKRLRRKHYQDYDYTGHTVGQMLALSPDLIQGNIILEIAKFKSNNEIFDEINANHPGAIKSVNVITKRLTHACAHYARDEGQGRTADEIRAIICAWKDNNQVDHRAKKDVEGYRAGKGKATRKAPARTAAAPGGAPPGYEPA